MNSITKLIESSPSCGIAALYKSSFSPLLTHQANPLRKIILFQPPPAMLSSIHRLSSPLFHCLHLANTPARQRSTAYHMLSFLSRHTLGKSPLFTCCSIIKVTGLRKNNSGDSPQDDESVLIHIFRPFQAATQFSLCKSRGTECRGATLCCSHGTGAGVAAQRERKRTGGTEKKNCPTKK